MGHELAELLQPLTVFGGIALVIWASAKAKLEHRKLDRQAWQPPVVPTIPQNEGAVLTELKALKQQMAEMQSTSHQFDLSFDAALNRLEGRVDRIETKAAAGMATPNTHDSPSTLRNGTTP